MDRKFLEKRVNFRGQKIWQAHDIGIPDERYFRFGYGNVRIRRFINRFPKI